MSPLERNVQYSLTLATCLHSAPQHRARTGQWPARNHCDSAAGEKKLKYCWLFSLKKKRSIIKGTELHKAPTSLPDRTKINLVSCGSARVSEKEEECMDRKKAISPVLLMEQYKVLYQDEENMRPGHNMLS